VVVGSFLVAVVFGGGGAAFGITDAAGVNRFLCSFLQSGVDRRVGLEAAIADGVEAVLVDQLLLDQVEEEGVADDPVLVPGVQLQAFVHSLVVFALRDVALVPHRFQHLVAALECGARVEEGVVFGRGLGQTGDHRRFGQAELAGGLAVVGLLVAGAQPRDAHQVVRGEAVPRELAVARLEHVERQQCMREEHGTERKHR